MYKIKEIYYTIQGEGYYTGRAAVFCRFAGCNLWSGREVDRSNAICTFCDTDFWGTDGKNGGKYDAKKLTEKILSLWPPDSKEKLFVVCTGGEPALQMDVPLVEEFHRNDFEIAIETNGTLELPSGIDWVCVSPKAGTTIHITTGNELKLVYPQIENSPDQFTNLTFAHFYLQPLDDTNSAEHTRLAVNYCLEHPKWKLSLQTHKILGID